MNNKFTPGPWSKPYYEADGHDKGWWIHNGKAGADEFAVAVTFSLNPNAEHDARLIAAAPDLLAALLGCIPQLELGNGEAAHIKAARAAITKATS